MNAPSALAEIQAMGASGYARRMASESHRRRVAAVARLFEQAVHGDRYAQLEFQDLMRGSVRAGAVREDMSTSDFPILFGDVLNRSLARRYAVAQPVWRQFAARDVRRDFRPGKVIDVFGAGGVLDRVKEHAPYPLRNLDESEFEMTLAKYGDRLAWSWEMGVNDDLGAFQNAPAALAQGAVSTEDYLAVTAIANASGPLTAVFGTVATGALSRDNLETGLASVMQAVDEDGQPIVIGTPVLMVPPALALTAQNIVNTTEITTQTGSGSGQRVAKVTGNGLSATPRVVVNPWLATVDKSANVATTWYLMPEPTGPRPAVYLSFLRGYESPDLRVKADAGMRLGGGSIDPSEGSFERDNVEYRIRHVVGGNAGFTDAVYASNGSA